MNKFKRGLSILAIGIFTLSSVGCVVKTQAGKDNTVVAKVNGEEIKVLDVRKAVKSSEEQIIATYGVNYKTNAAAVEELKQVYSSALESLVQEKVLYFKAVEFGLVPDANKLEEEVKKEIDTIKESQFGNDQTKFEEAIKTAGLTIEDLKMNVRESLRDNPKSVAANRVEAHITKGIKVEDKEIEEYYNTNIVQFTINPGAKFRHILVETEDKAKEVKVKLNEGAKFEELAKEYSTDTASKDLGGDLGFYSYDGGQLIQEFMDAGKKLGEGQISEPVKTTKGWHVIKATDLQKEAKVQPLSEVKESIKTQLLSKNKRTEYDSQLAKWQETFKVKTYSNKLVKNIL